MVSDLSVCLVVCVNCGDDTVGALAVSADIFNEGDAPRLLTSMNCIGNESNLLGCDKIVFSGINCPTSGVVCQGRLFPL